jgi:cytochrome b
MQAQRITVQHVFDPLLRLMHWWNALAIIGLAATSQIAEVFEHGPYEATVWRFHIQFGYALVGGLIARLIWGFVGPQSARWSDLWHPKEWMGALRGRFRIPPRQGHDALASAAFLGLYAILAAMSVTGLVLAAIEHDMGPFATTLSDDMGLKHLFKEPHEAGFALVLAFIGLHLGALVWHRFFLKLPVDQAMVTGTQYLPAENPHA